LNKSFPDALTGNSLRVPVQEDEALVSLFLAEVFKDLRPEPVDCAVSRRDTLQANASAAADAGTGCSGVAGEYDGIDVATELSERYPLPALLMSGAFRQSSNDMSLMSDRWAAR
jgi:hypothetical protein